MVARTNWTGCSSPSTISGAMTSGSFEKFYLGTRERVIRVIINRMAENDEIAARCLNDPDFAQVVLPGLLRRIYDIIWAQEPAPTPRA